ncbi:uncharacterized protein BDZ83DRAFT_231519 [Colletotrichum acutatum]|uniref:Secreted protein n=1 Tax=Glomerella acutata TaxID=27357 RepID=A0AAD8UTP2_GLOAC|nr:uncharacterized protein BDZ83DRAFT_231519 [Colletotrichum acutatum]KAK1726939.1 hypothetical protein BDZ83DRAFT_231519 [Colletotrichum acutatum]
MISSGMKITVLLANILFCHPLAIAVASRSLCSSPLGTLGYSAKRKRCERVSTMLCNHRGGEEWAGGHVHLGAEKRFPLLPVFAPSCIHASILFTSQLHNGFSKLSDS